MPLNYDGVTDDRAILQDMIDNAQPYSTIELEPNRVCRIVVDNTVLDHGLILKPNIKLKLNGTKLNYELHGDVYGTRLQSNAQVVDGRLSVAVSDGLSSLQGIYQSVISLGAAYSEVTSASNLGPFIEASGWGIHNVELSTVKSNGLHISGVGGLAHGHISDIVGLSNSNALGLVNFDWGTVGPTGTIPQNRANFNNSNGSFYTVHPTDIKIERVRAGIFSNPSSEIIRLSGASAVDVSNVYIQAAGYSGFSHYGGDFGYEFAKYGPTRNNAFMNTSLRNMSLLASLTHAIRLDAFADNISREPGYVPLTNPVYPSNILIDGIAAVGLGTVLNIGSIAGGVLTRIRANGFHVGASFQPNVSRMVISNSVIHGGDSSAIQTTGSTAGVTFSNVVFEN